MGDGTADLYRQTRRAAAWGVGVTLTLGVAKLVGGWYGHSLALLSDSVHSLGDALASASVFLALRWAERPPDAEHPYGHARAETIAASNVALLLVGSGVWIVYEAIRAWGQPTPPPHWSTLAVALLSVVANEVVFRYSMSVARRTGSKAIEASAWDQRLDVFGSLVVLAGLLVATWAGPEWHVVDRITALLVAGIVLWAGGSLFWGSLQDLMDRQADAEVVAAVRRLACEVAGVEGVEKLFVRKSGLEFFVDIHIEVDPGISVRAGHAIGHAVSDRLMREAGAVKGVLVHVEPSPNPAGSA